jgi:small subunit ribosomal protein S17
MSVEVERTAAPRLRQGVVLKTKMSKTVVVEVVRRFRHSKYLKFLKRRVRYTAHDETNACNVGDQVIMEETRPMSKTKRWRVKEIVQREVGA